VPGFVVLARSTPINDGFAKLLSPHAWLPPAFRLTIISCEPRSGATRSPKCTLVSFFRHWLAWL
jgi:hypothetical protein